MSCLGLTKTGNKCSRKTKENSQYCCQHIPEEKKVENNVKNEGLTILPLQYILNRPSYLAGKGIFLEKYTQEINKQLIKDVLLQVHPYMKINPEALEFINFITYSLYSKFAEAKTITEFDESINKSLPDQLKTHAIAEIMKERNKLTSLHATTKQILDKVKITLIEYLIAEIIEI